MKGGDTITVSYLCCHTEFIETVSHWIYTEFVGPTVRTTSLEQLKEHFSTTYTDKLPITLVCILDNQCAGTVSLFQNDLKSQEVLTPWLAALFVPPAYRSRGIAQKLITHVEQVAKILGYDAIYLRTEHAAGLYRQLGWEHLFDATDENNIKTSIFRYFI